MYKLRTMHDGSSGPAVTAAEDDRVTRTGRWLRRTGLDEWPQLVNVLRGEMSLVGPRPEAPRFVDEADARWRRVHTVRPGVTGPTQLHFAAEEERLLRGPGVEAKYVEQILPRKLAMDIAYVDGRSLGRDLRCLAETALWIVRRRPDSRTRAEAGTCR